MYYRRGKGARIYRNSGFRNFGCMGSIFLLPFILIGSIIRTIINR